MVLSCLFILILAEVALRFFPVNELLGSLPVNKTNPMLRYLPNRDLTWSKFADFSMVNEVHVNNYGFLNDKDYVKSATSPLVAVIGDSFIEAAMIPFPETLQARLDAKLGNTWRVYSFARSGAPLSQYLACAQWAVEVFHPSYLIFNIVSNDFDESLLDNASFQGFHYFQHTSEGWFLNRIDYTPSLGSTLVRHSRLLAYLLTNAAVQNIPQQVMNLFTTTPADGPEGSANDKRLEDSRAAMDAFFTLLPQLVDLAPGKICFVMDADRPGVYRDAPKPNVFGTVRAEFLQQASARGYRTIDLNPVFREDYRIHAKRFEFPMDGHWTPYAHGLAAETILRSGFPDISPKNEAP